MTLKNSHNLQKSVACREYTLPRDEKSSGPKDWMRGNTKIDPYWKSQSATYKVNMEWKLELSLVNKDNSQSWVRISHGLTKLVTDLSNNKRTTTTSRKPLKCSAQIVC